MGSGSEISYMETAGDLGNLKDKAKRLELDIGQGREEYSRLQKAVHDEQAKHDEEDERTKQLLNQKEDLIYEIKQLKNRKERLEKQNQVFQKIISQDPIEFRNKAESLQDDLQLLIKAQKQQVEDLGSQLQPITKGKDAFTETIGLPGLKNGSSQQQELHSTLSKLERVLKAKALSEHVPVVNSTKDTNGAVSKKPAKVKSVPAKPAVAKRTPGRKAAKKSYAEGDDDDEGQGDSSVDGIPVKKRSASVASSRASSKRRVNHSDDDD